MIPNITRATWWQCSRHCHMQWGRAICMQFLTIGVIEYNGLRVDIMIHTFQSS